MSQPTLVALVPMRHQSQRVPGKNYRPLAGKPLYHHILQKSASLSLISTVVINTDSPVIIEGVSRDFPQVRLLERPEHLRADTVPTNDILLYDVSQVPADFYLQTHSTNPLLSIATITQAIEQFLDHYPIYDSLFSVTRLQTRLWDALARAVNHNPAMLLRTQDLPPIYEENSCLYLFTRALLERRHNRIGERPLLFTMERHEAWDIDEEIDFRIAEFLYHEQQKERYFHEVDCYGHRSLYATGD
ncbi:MAG: acylneuraminate cytidylyltransferase family protein [Chloroflexaceae bacterium]|nr:acylneuraminate cytidylyltransferase family protein [Chloroflexaceae bacterium]